MYILRCCNGAFYTGVTTDIERRIREHHDNGRLAARFTRAFAPVELAYSCEMGSKQLAFQAEYRIKRLPREKKALVVSKNISKTDLLVLLGIENKRRSQR